MVFYVVRNGVYHSLVRNWLCGSYLYFLNRFFSSNFICSEHIISYKMQYNLFWNTRIFAQGWRELKDNYCSLLLIYFYTILMYLCFAYVFQLLIMNFYLILYLNYTLKLFNSVLQIHLKELLKTLEKSIWILVFRNFKKGGGNNVEL